MVRARLVLLTVLSLFVCAPARAEPAAAEVRALWVVRTAMTSPAAVSTMISTARAAGFNTLVVQVRGRGDAFYRSRHEPRAKALASQPQAFDPLALAILQAHAAGLKVHAWVNVNLVADPADMPTDRRHVVYRHPEWLMLPAELAKGAGDPKKPAYLARLVAWARTQTATVEGLYTSPISSDSAEYVTDVVSDLVSHYAVDGIHFDYVRYPGPGFDYSRHALKAFRKEVSRTAPKQTRKTVDALTRTNRLAWPERYPTEWREFRRQQLTSLVRRLRLAVAQKRPGIIVSAAVVPDAEVAANSRLQDWPSWIGQGLLDVICPMLYTTDSAVYKAQVDKARMLARGRGLWAGVGAYRLTPEQTLKHIGLARAAKADGLILFSYDSPAAGAGRSADTLVRIGQQAFK